MMRKDHTTTTKKRNPKLLVLLSSPAAFLVAIVTIILIYSSLLEAKQDEQRNEEIINSTSIINEIGGAGRKSQNHITCGSCSSGADHYAGARTGVVVLCSAAQSSSEAISSKCLGQEDVGAVVPTTSYQGVCCCSDNVEPPLGEASIAWCSQERATFCEAKAICGRNGARLCTKQEALNECTTGTGCGFLDGNMVWTCDQAPPKQIGNKYEERNKKVVGARAGGTYRCVFTT